ncbi:hypothetical protein DAPPUDRAFT_240024 [Daphnia pulex]|uniref:Uncharacterized protein n=1 Tax=Daphnia pulex TaxID=6669 RepID=E9GAP8_DAPPU|nr:hypothetical protein DAPPUDRAFT_240024 [Daphnia pulex]|eukprot:EFX83295.1 hypothetical protein DAPPUDRAFT_240024 [Daphnia pulex]
MPTPDYTTTKYASAGYYIIKAPVNYTTTYDAPSYYADALNYRYSSLTGFVLLLNIVSLLAESTPGVPWVWRILIYYAAVFLHQHTQRPVTTPGLRTTTPKMLNITQGRMLPQFTTPRNLSQRKAPVYYTANASDCYMKIYAAPNYYTGALRGNTNNQFASKGKYALFGDVLLLNLLSLMDMTGVISDVSLVWRIYIATLLSYYATTYSTTCYYTGTFNYYTEKAEYYSRTHATPVCYTEEPKHYSEVMRYYQTEAPVYYTTNASECYMKIYAALNYYTGASKSNTINVQPIGKQGSLMAGSHEFTDVFWATRLIYTNIYAAPSYCTEVSLYPKLHQQNFEYYTEDLKHYTTIAKKYYTEAVAY